MKKEEILAKYRKDNQGLDEREKMIKLKANKCSVFVGLLFCFIIVSLELVFADTTILSFVSFSTMYLIFAIDSWILAVNFQNKKIYFKAILQTILFVCCFLIVLHILLNTHILQL